MHQLNKINLRRYIIGVVIASPIAVILGFLSAGFGHGDYLFAKLLFPLTMLSSHYTGNVLLSPFVLFALVQFPLYGVVLALSNMFKKDVIVALLLFVFHLSAVILCFVWPMPSFPHR